MGDAHEGGIPNSREAIYYCAESRLTLRENPF